MLIAGVQVAPEIWLDVADNLETKDIKNLLFVNHEFHDILLHLRFQTLDIDLSSDSSDVYWLIRDINDAVKTHPFRYFKKLKFSNLSTRRLNSDFWEFLQDCFGPLMRKLRGLQDLVVTLDVERVEHAVISEFLKAICVHHQRVRISMELMGVNMYGFQQYTLGYIVGVRTLSITGGLASREDAEKIVEENIAKAIINSPKLTRLILEDIWNELEFDDVLAFITEEEMPRIKHLVLAEISPPIYKSNLLKLNNLDKLTLDTRGGGKSNRSEILEHHSEFFKQVQYYGRGVLELSVDTVTFGLMEYLSPGRLTMLEINLPSYPGDLVEDVETMRVLARQFWGETVPILLEGNLASLTVMFHENHQNPHECPWNPVSEPARRWGLEYLAKHAHKYHPRHLRYLNIMCPTGRKWAPTALRALAIIASRNRVKMQVDLSCILNNVISFEEDASVVDLDITGWANFPEGSENRKFKFRLAWQYLVYCGCWSKLERFRAEEIRLPAREKEIYWKPMPKRQFIGYDSTGQMYRSDDDDGVVGQMFRLDNGRWLKNK